MECFEWGSSRVRVNNIKRHGLGREGGGQRGVINFYRYYTPKKIIYVGFA